MNKNVIDFNDVSLGSEFVEKYRKEDWFKRYLKGTIAPQVKRGTRARVRVIDPDHELIDTFEVDGTKDDD